MFGVTASLSVVGVPKAGCAVLACGSSIPRSPGGFCSAVSCLLWSDLRSVTRKESWVMVSCSCAWLPSCPGLVLWLRGSPCAPQSSDYWALVCFLVWWMTYAMPSVRWGGSPRTLYTLVDNLFPDFDPGGDCSLHCHPDWYICWCNRLLKLFDYPCATKQTRVPSDLVPSDSRKLYYDPNRVFGLFIAFSYSAFSFSRLSEISCLSQTIILILTEKWEGIYS